jgi:orotate phosphoribosyltransferase
LLTRSFRFGEFILSSGKRSSYYFDGKQVTLHSQGAYLVARAVLEKVKGKEVQAIGGPTIGADPIVGAVAVICALKQLDYEFFIVRKDAKQHGRKRQLEGPQLQSGMRVAVVDDVLTTGASMITAVEAVQAAGGEVVVAVVLVDRREGGAELLGNKGVSVDPVFTIEDFQV